MRPAVPVIIALASALLLGLSFTHRIATEPKEAVAAVAGLVGVYLVVLENPWNWPIGVVSSGFYVVVFLNSRLFGDAGLNVVYVVLGLLGWYWWLRGGAGRGGLKISRLDARGWALSLVALAAMTTGLHFYFVSVADAAPFLDALTTSLSLVAQILLTRKVLENWIFWIVADVIYVPLYWSRHLGATALLYLLFLWLAFVGMLEWDRTRREALEPTAIEPTHA